MTKGNLMKLIYSKDELRNIDSAIPIEYWDKINTSNYVMNYNNNGVFGKLENLLEVAKERNIKLK